MPKNVIILEKKEDNEESLRKFLMFSLFVKEEFSQNISSYMVK